MLEKIKQFLNNWAGNVREYWDAGYRFRAGFTFIVPPILVALTIILLFLGVSAVFDFLRRYYAQLFFMAVGICIFVAWLDKRKADNLENERKAQDIRERQNYSDQFEAARTKDATYVAGAKIVFPCARELGPLGIVPPATLTNIYSQGRTVPQMGGAVLLNVYLLQKDRETVDTDLLQHILQTKIDQLLADDRIPGVDEAYIYRGHSYSGFIIDRVRDSPGGFVEVYTAFVNDSYCEYRERRNLNGGILLPSVDRRDTDY